MHQFVFLCTLEANHLLWMSDIDIECPTKKRKINVESVTQYEQVLTDDDSSSDSNEDDDKEDYERSIKYYLKDGVIVDLDI